MNSYEVEKLVRKIEQSVLKKNKSVSKSERPIFQKNNVEYFILMPPLKC